MKDWVYFWNEINGHEYFGGENSYRDAEKKRNFYILNGVKVGEIKTVN